MYNSTNEAPQPTAVDETTPASPGQADAGGEDGATPSAPVDNAEKESNSQPKAKSAPATLSNEQKLAGQTPAQTQPVVKRDETGDTPRNFIPTIPEGPIHADQLYKKVQDALKLAPHDKQFETQKKDYVQAKNNRNDARFQAANKEATEHFQQNPTFKRLAQIGCDAQWKINQLAKEKGENKAEATYEHRSKLPAVLQECR